MLWFTMAVGLATRAAATAPISPAVAITEFHTYCQRGAAIWKRSLCGPLLFVDPATRAATANFDPAIPGFERHGAVWEGALPPTVGIANTSVEVAGIRAAEILLPLPGEAVERRILISHESFHRIQPLLGFRAAEADNGHLDARDARIQLRLEIAALRSALLARNWPSAAGDALAFRAQRLRHYPGSALAEARLIGNEGLAEYTGIRVGAPGHVDRLALKRLASATDRPSLVRSLGYVVGPAYGLLLDRTGRPWRGAALRGSPLPDLLARAIGRGDLRHQPSSGKYGASRIVAEETARDAKNNLRRAELNSKLVSGPTVTFPFERMKIEFNPNSVFSLGAAGNVYSEAATIRDAWGSLRVTREVLLSADWSFARVPGPSTANGNILSGPGWVAELATGYSTVPGDRPGDLKIHKN